MVRHIVTRRHDLGNLFSTHPEVLEQDYALYIGRKPPLPAQISCLESTLGIQTIVEVRDSIPIVLDLLEMIETYRPRFVIPIIPLSMIAQLLEFLREKDLRTEVMYPDMETHFFVRGSAEDENWEFDLSRDISSAFGKWVVVRRFKQFRVLWKVELVDRGKIQCR